MLGFATVQAHFSFIVAVGSGLTRVFAEVCYIIFRLVSDTPFAEGFIVFLWRV